MKKKILLFILSLIMIVSTVSFLGCVMTPPDNGDNSANNNDADTGDDDIDYSDEYGTVTIDDIFVLINGTKEIVPVFSMPREAEDLTYTFSGSAITITDGIIKGVLLNSETTVTATSEHFKTTFRVTVVEQIFAISTIEPLIAGYYYPLTVEFENVSRNDDITDLEFNFGVSSSYFSVENGNLKATQDTPVGYYTFRAKLGKFITKFSVRVGDKSEIGLGTHGTYTTRYNIVKDRVNSNIDVLFAGDSFMDDYFFKDFYDRFSGKNAQTVGISSTTVTDWIFYAQELIVSANPNAIVLHVGTNDIFDDKRTNVTENANNLITLFEIIHAKLPNTHIYWWTIEERINQSSYSSIVQGVNIAVKNYASTHTSFLTVVDTYSLMDVNDKSMWRENDTVHPSNPHGYDVFMQATVNAGLDSSYAPNVSFDIENVPLLYPGYYVDFNPELPGSVTYSVNKTGLTITDGKIIALETATAGDYTVTAKVGSFSDTFTVTVKDTTTIYTNSDGGKGSLYGKQDNGDEFIEGNNRFGSLINRVSANLGNDLTLFAGDSFMDERWFFRDFYNRFLGKNAQTVGISSSRAEQWIWYMQKLIVPANPKNLVMHIGTNDIFDGKQTAGTVTGYLTEMFDLLHQRLPNTTIYWWTIEERIGQSASSSKVTTLNANIVNYANGKNWLKIVDTYSILDVNDYSLWNPKESTSTGVDNVHPSNPKGYDLFMQATVNAGLNIADNALEILNTEGNQFRKYSLNYANNFVFKTTATVSNYYNNGHLSFNLNNSDSTRFLIWDNDSNGTFKYTIYNISANDVYDFSQTDKTIEIAILLTAKNAYMFVDGKLRCAYLYVNDGSLTSNFSFGSQGVDVKFENLIVDGTSSDAYKELLSNAQVSYYENLNKTTETKISDLAIVSATGTTLNDKTVVNDTDNYGNATATGYTKNFIFESKYTLTQAGSNAHITLHFDYQSGTNPTTRFLIMNTDSDADFEFTTNNWDGAGKGTTGLPLAVNGTIKFQVVVTDGNAYLFADGILKCAYLNIEIKNFYYGAENMSGVFTETKICEYGSAGTSAFADAIKEYEAINSTATSEFTDIDQSVSYMASFNTVNGTDNFDLSRGIGKTENFMFETSITINSYSNNAHLTFNFNDNPNTRFLIHEEENGSNVFKYRISYVSGTGSVTLSSDTPTTLKVAILVTDGNAYMFVNGTLYCAYLNIGKISTFEVGSELLSANFNSNLIYTNGSSVYADYLAKVTSYENTANNNSATQKIVI